MITPFVMRVFERLASDAILDIVRSADPRSPADIDSFMEETFRLDSDIESTYEDMKKEDAAASAGEPSKKEMFRHVFEQLLEGIASGGTSSAKAVSAGDVTHLMNQIRMVLQKTLEGKDRESKSAGLRKKLEEFREGLSKSETQKSTAKEVVEFVREVFSGEVDGLVRTYWWSRQRGGDLKGNLQIQDMGSKEKAEEQAEMLVFTLLLEGTRNSIKEKLYENASDDAHALGKIVSGVWHRIKNRDTGDKYDGETAATGKGGKYSRGKWYKYIAPLQDTGKFGHGESLDILGITGFLNEHFLRKDLDSKTLVDAPLPGGGTMTAPSFKTELKSTQVHQWATGSSAGVSMDTPIGDEDGTLGETIGAPDARPYEETEEGVAEWLEASAERDPSRTNRDLAKDDIRGWVDEVMRRVSVPLSNKDAVKDILLVKMGLVSSEVERNRFLKKWLGDEILKRDMSWPRFRAEAIGGEIWKELGEPFRKGWMRGWKKSDGPAPTESPYSKDWKQQALVNKTTGEQFVGRLDALKKENQDNLEVVTKVHKKGDEPKKQHMLNWTTYNQEDRKADFNRALDMYDGEQWFEQSVNEDVRRELEKSNETLAEAFRKFRPESIFTAISKGSDTEMIRAMGYVKPSLSLETGKTPFKKHPEIYPDVKKAIGKLGEVMVEGSKDDDGAFRYLSLKRLGKVASRIEFELVILAAVVDLMEGS